MALDMGSEIDRYVLHRLHHNLFHRSIGMRIHQPKSHSSYIKQL
jgi:hypothetical protein